MLRYHFERGLEASVERQWDLPQVYVVMQSEYLELLVEARDLYIDGRFYSCVAMCGIVNERLIKDVLRVSIRIEKEGIVEKPNSATLNKLERVDIRSLIEFARGATLITEEVSKAAKDLGDLRNKYAHARGDKPDEGAQEAIKLLHKVVEGTVSVFKDHDLKNGKLVRKSVDGA